MNTEHIVIADFVSGQMSAEEREAARRHLERCSRCRAAAEAARQIELEQKSRQIGNTLLAFTLNLVQGSLSMVAAPLRQTLVKPSEPIATREEPAVHFEPLRVLKPRVAGGAQSLLRFVGRFGLVLALTVLVLLLPTPRGLSSEGHRALALFVFTGSILALEPVSLPIAALIVPLAQVALGIAETAQAFETFSRPVVFLILSSLFLAEALRKHGITRRLALSSIFASGGVVPLLLLGLMGIAAVLSMWVENTATAAVLIPAALTISRQIPDPKKARRLLSLLGFGIAYAASLGGMVTIMGSSSNAVASGFLAELGSWTFIDWMKYGLPAFLLIFPLTWQALLRLVPLSGIELDVEPARRQLDELGPVGRAEKEILITLGVAVVLWVGGSFIEPALNLPSTLLSSAMVAVMVVAYLAIRGIIDWEDVKGISWGIFLIIGAGLSLGEVLNRTGATDWFAGLIVPLVKGPPLFVSLLLLVFLSALLTNVMNNTTIAAVFVPILISMARADPSLDAVQLVLPVTLATTFGYSLPSASSRMSLIAASGIVERGDMMRIGLLLTLISSAVLGVFFYLLTVLNWI